MHVPNQPPPVRLNLSGIVQRETVTPWISDQLLVGVVGKIFVFVLQNIESFAIIFLYTNVTS